jgi:hypothetical protein
LIREGGAESGREKGKKTKEIESVNGLEDEEIQAEQRGEVIRKTEMN